MRITFDPAKRAKTLADRGLDFTDAAKIFSGVTLEIEDTRKDYGETRIIVTATWKDELLLSDIRHEAQVATYLA